MTSSKISTTISTTNSDLATMGQHAGAAANLLKALANPARLQILCLLDDQEKSAGELTDLIGLSQSALSQHLAKLRQDQLVTTRRESQTIYYSVTQGPAQDIIKVLHHYFCSL